MTLTDVTSVLKNPSSIDSFSLEEITALAIQHPNIPQVRAVLLQKRMHAEEEFPVDFVDTNYYYADNQHFINDVFQIQLDDEKADQEKNQDAITSSKQLPVTESASDIKLKSEDQQANKSKENHLEADVSVDTTNQTGSGHHLYARIEASPYANWLLSLKQTKQATSSTGIQSSTVKEELVKDLEQVDSDSSVKDKTGSDSAIKETLKEESNRQLADNSSTLNEEIASESLAELLAKQGHQKKAITMYEKLSLIFPEKSAYFAIQIKKINRK